MKFLKCNYQIYISNRDSTEITFGANPIQDGLLTQLTDFSQLKNRYNLVSCTNIEVIFIMVVAEIHHKHILSTKSCKIFV